MPLDFVHYIHGDMKSSPEKDMWEMYLLSPVNLVYERLR